MWALVRATARRICQISRHLRCSGTRTLSPRFALTAPLTILHLLAPAPVGGLETVVTTLAAAQRRAGHHVVVAPTLSGPGDGWNFIEALKPLDVHIEPLSVSGRGYLREGRLIREICRGYGVSVVHTHGYRSDVVGGHAGHGAGKPVITTVHGFTGGGLKNRGFEALQRFAFRRFDAVVAVSRPQADQLRRGGVPSERLHVVPNALAAHPNPLSRIEARRALNLAEAGVIAGWVGRVSREKGVDIFIDAMTELRDIDVRAAIMGDGPERAAEQARAESAAPGKISWLGAVSDAARYYAAFDLFVMSSRAEGLPMVLLEAMAAGIPIVTTSVGGIPDLLSPLEGTLVPPQDSQALAAAIRDALTNSDATAARARAAKVRQAEHFAVGPWSARYESIYRALIAARASARA